MDYSTTPYAADVSQQTPPPIPVAAYGYAGFWKRFAANFIDGIILFVPSLLAGLAVGIFYGLIFQTKEGAGWLGGALGVGIGWLYSAWFESSSKQATLGKMAVGIKVTDADGNRLSFARASGRFFSKYLSGLICGVGFLMAAFTPKKQALHDICAGCLVVNKGPRTNAAIIVLVVVLGAMIPAMGILSAALFPAVTNAVMTAHQTVMANRAKNIYIAIESARGGTERLHPIWPKSGKKMEDTETKDKDISEMTFANSSDYFWVLLDGENMDTPLSWAPYVWGLDFSQLAGAGVPPKEGEGRLTAEHNAWTIAANLTDDMPDIIPVLITRNVDPASLIPREGDLSKQFLRPSKYVSPFPKGAFVGVYKGGGVIKLPWRYASLDVIYRNASGEELQAIRDAFQKIEYLMP